MYIHTICDTYVHTMYILNYIHWCFETFLNICVQYTVCTVHYTLNSVQCTMYSLHCTLYNVWRTLCAAQCTVYTVHIVHCQIHN